MKNLIFSFLICLLTSCASIQDVNTNQKIVITKEGEDTYKLKINDDLIYPEMRMFQGFQITATVGKGRSGGDIFQGEDRKLVGKIYFEVKRSDEGLLAEYTLTIDRTEKYGGRLITGTVQIK